MQIERWPFADHAKERLVRALAKAGRRPARPSAVPKPAAHVDTTWQRDRILRERVVKNGATWRRMLAAGLARCWASERSGDPEPPEITLEPSLFKETCKALWVDLLRQHDLRTRRLRRLELLHRYLGNSRTARRARVILACPPWVNRRQIREIYAEMRRMNRSSGTAAWHVDHIIPIAGQDVSGLHVPWNLRIIRARANLRKGRSVDKETLTE